MCAVKKYMRLTIHKLILYFLDLLKKYIKKRSGLTLVMSGHPGFKLTR